MKYSGWADVVGPKVNGTRNLHKALTNRDPDIFWLLNSILAAVNQVDQGNYLTETLAQVAWFGPEHLPC